MMHVGSDEELHLMRPRVVPELRIGPALWDGAKQRYTLHDPRTGWYFQVGEKEHFLIRRLDGEHTLAVIEVEFAEVFQRRLTPNHWYSLFELLGQRGLLEGSDSPLLLMRLCDARASQIVESRTVLHARFPLVRVDALLMRLAPVTRALDRGKIWVAVWVGVVLVIGYVLFRWNEVWAQARAAWQNPVVLCALVILLWGSIILHELAHGAIALNYGARDIHIGFMWRMPVFVPYCQVDDIRLFHNRRERALVALAGPTMSVALCLPFGVIHAIFRQGDFGVLCAAMITFGLASGLVNLVPIFRMDGYLMLTHLLDVEDLEKSASAVIGGIFRRSDARAVGGPKWVTYLIYGIGALLVQSVLVILFAIFLVRYLEGVIPTVAALCLTTVGIMLFFVIGILMTRRQHRKLAALPGADYSSTGRWGET